jgi:hypothetical protein
MAAVPLLGVHVPLAPRMSQLFSTKGQSAGVRVGVGVGVGVLGL